jgi:hypothetical protein
VSAFKKKPLDVFDASFTSAVQSQAAELVKPRAGDPQVLGYTYTDGPPWIIEDDSGSEDFQKLTVAEKIIHPWCLALMSLPAEANGKQVWLATMKGRYSSPEDAGATYACKVSGWDELASTTAWTSISDSAKAADDSLAFGKNHAAVVRSPQRCHPPVRPEPSYSGRQAEHEPGLQMSGSADPESARHERLCGRDRYSVLRPL